MTASFYTPYADAPKAQSACADSAFFEFFRETAASNSRDVDATILDIPTFRRPSWTMPMQVSTDASAAIANEHSRPRSSNTFSDKQQPSMANGHVTFSPFGGHPSSTQQTTAWTSSGPSEFSKGCPATFDHSASGNGGRDRPSADDITNAIQNNFGQLSLSIYSSRGVSSGAATDSQEFESDEDSSDSSCAVALIQRVRSQRRNAITEASFQPCRIRRINSSGTVRCLKPMAAARILVANCSPLLAQLSES